MYMCVDGKLTTSVTYGPTEGRIEKDIGYRDAKRVRLMKNKF